jgi:hypothetical protein
MNITTMTTEELISTPQFAKIVGIVRATLQTYIDQGKVPYEKVTIYPSGTKKYLLSKSLADAIAESTAIGGDWDTPIEAYKMRKELLHGQ